MKIRVITEMDLETGDYELEFHNMSAPGEGIDYWLMTEALRRVFLDFERRVEHDDEPLGRAVTKDLH